MKPIENINLTIRDTNDLFVAPPQDPLSNYDYIQAGESALGRAIRHIKSKNYKKINEINIHLPQSVIKTTNITGIQDNLSHYLHFQIKEHNEDLMLFKQKASRIFRNAMLFLMLCMAIVSILGMESFLPNLPPLMRTVLIEGFTVVGWVVMWRPVELFLNEWTSLKIENQIYQVLLKTKIKIQPSNCA